MDVKKLQKIYDVLKDSKVSEMELEADDVKVKIKRGAQEYSMMGKKSQPTITADNTDVAEQKSDDRATAAKASEATAKAVAANVEDMEANSFDIHSPEIGEFSRFNPVNKRQFVKLRDVVKVGDAIGVVTAMHIAHEVRADKDGKIVGFLVEEKQPVEFGQPLVRCIPI